MKPSKLLSSVFHAAKSRLGSAGTQTATADQHSHPATADDSLAPPVPPPATAIADPPTFDANYSSPDFRLRSEITDPAAATLGRQYADRSIALVALGGMVARQDAIIAKTIFEFFQKTTSLRHVTPATLSSHIAEFRRVFLTSPHKANSGGANFTTALNLFLIARCLSPKLIVECGVFKGASSYILKAACPNAQVLAFDPNLAELTHRTPGVTYYEHDWMRIDVRCSPPGTGLCYFDDHQDQATRVKQAHQRGIRHILMDDSWPLEVPGCGWPPIPSIEMIMNNWLKVGESARWIEDGMMWTFVQTEETHQLIEHARSLIKDAHDLPSLYRQTGVAPTSAGKYVELN